MIDIKNAITLKELDSQLAVVKGTSFRLFKGVLKNLIEGTDYYYLDANNVTDGVTINILKDNDRIYSSTTHAVLLTPKLAKKLTGLYAIVKDKL